MKFKPVLVALLTVTLIAAAAPAQAGNDTSWIPLGADFRSPGLHGFAFSDQTPLTWQFSVLQGGSGKGMVVCTSTSDTNCSGADFFKFNSVLKVCSSASELNCIAGVSAQDSSITDGTGTFSKYTITNHLNAYPEDIKAEIPAGGMPSIWSIPSAPHASGSDYAVVAVIAGDSTKNGQANSISNTMQLSLIPVTLKDFGKGQQSIAEGWSQAKPGIFYDYCTTWQQTPTNSGADCNHVNGPACILPTVEQGVCYAEEAFGKIQKFNVQLRLRSEPNGWMHGRMIDPSISITPNPSGGTNLSVTAGASTVPMVYQDAQWNTLSDEIKNLWVECFKDQRLCASSGWYREGPIPPKFETLNTLEGQAKTNILLYMYGFGDLPLRIMAAISPLIGNKSSALSNTWSMRTLTNQEMSGANSCFTKSPGLKGIVTTNSTAYSAGPPEFKDGTLNYQVSSPHFNPDGTTPFKGNYNLVMRSDVARCIYGFSSAPINASISVVSSEGSADVATTVAAEKDGWIALSANNFQFSAPTIQVKFTQEAPVVPAVAPTATQVVVAPKPTSKQVTITCVKGKTSKRVSAAKPTCPKGYVKK